MISFIVALDENKGIGKDNHLPWHIKDDLKLFKQNTLNHKIIMGMKTYLSLPKKLIDRYPIVVTRNVNYQNDDSDVIVINDLNNFLVKHLNDDEEYIVCGGASIYEQSYKYAQKAYVSLVKGCFDCDSFFSVFNLNDFKIIKEIDYEEFKYLELVRN